MRLQRQQQRDVRHIKQQGITQGCPIQLAHKTQCKNFKNEFSEDVICDLGRRTEGVVNARIWQLCCVHINVSVSPLLA